MHLRRPSFIGVLIGIWAVWFSLVALSNVFDGLKAMGLLGEHWRFASGNFAAIEQVTSIYKLPRFVNGLLYLAVIVVEIGIANLLWRSLGRRDPKTREAAFTLAVALFGGFLLADELFVAWPTGLAHVHFGILVALIVTWIAARNA
jgi:hypothetical protein